MIYTYEYSPVVRGDGHFEFGIKEEGCSNLVRETCKMILDQAFSGFSSDSSMPRIPKEVFDFNGELARAGEIIESMFIIRGEGTRNRMGARNIV